MPSIKKRAGKTTFTIYATEARQFRGVIDVLNFIELNHDKDDRLASNAGVLSSGLGAILHAIEKPSKETKQRELIKEKIEADA